MTMTSHRTDAEVNSFSMSQQPETTDDLETIEPVHAADIQRWNSPRINICRFFSTLYSFVIMGMNDAAFGVRLSFVIFFAKR